MESATLHKEVFKVGPRHLFHDNEKAFVVESKIMDGDDLWVGQIGRRFGFQVEAVAKGLVK